MRYIKSLLWTPEILHAGRRVHKLPAQQREALSSFLLSFLLHSNWVKSIGFVNLRESFLPQQVSPYPTLRCDRMAAGDQKIHNASPCVACRVKFRVVRALWSNTNLNIPGRQTEERNWIIMNQQLSQYDHSNQIKISTTNPDEIQRSPHKPAAFCSSAWNLNLILAVKRSIKLQGV